MINIIEATELDFLEEELIISLNDYKGTKDGFYKKLLKIVNDAEQNYNSKEINRLNSYIAYRKSFGESAELWENQKRDYEKQQNDFPYKIGYRRYSTEKFKELKTIIEKFNNKTEIIEANFLDFIHNVNNKEDFAIELKRTFNIETGIDFKIMIELLKEEGIFSFTQFAPFFRSVLIYFNRDIGSQNGLNDLYKHSKDEQIYYAERIVTIQNKLNILITSHKIK